MATKEVKKSKAQLKVENTIEKLTAKKKEQGFLSPHEARVLVNSIEKLEDKGAKRLYKFLKEYIKDVNNKEHVDTMLGGAKFVKSFAEFCEYLPKNKVLFSKWDAFGVLTKMNKGAAQLAKAKKQEEKQAKKLAA